MKMFGIAAIVLALLAPAANAWEDEFCADSIMVPLASTKAEGVKWCRCILTEAATWTVAEYESVVLALANDKDKAAADIKARRTGPPPTASEVEKADENIQGNMNSLFMQCVKPAR